MGIQRTSYRREGDDVKVTVSAVTVDVMELVFALPTPKLREVTSRLALIHPGDESLIMLKERPSIPGHLWEDYVELEGEMDYHRDYKEYIGKSVLLTASDFKTARGRNLMKMLKDGAVVTS